MNPIRLASGFATAALLWGAAAPSGTTAAPPRAGAGRGASVAASWVEAPASVPHLAGVDVRAKVRRTHPFPPARVHRTLVRIPSGSYLPLYTPGGRTDERVPVAAFELDVVPVTRGEFAAFVSAHPEWRRSRVPTWMRQAGYLAEWQGDLDYGTAADATRPVTAVPQAAARAFCEAEGKRLPTIDEWEYAAAASEGRADASADVAFKERLLALYTRPRPAAPSAVGSMFRNAYGIWDLHGLVWEWTERAQQQQAAEGGHHDDMAHRAMHHGPGKHDMGCAGTAVGASDTRNYAAFLRYAFREAVAPTGLSTALGFRCAR